MAVADVCQQMRHQRGDVLRVEEEVRQPLGTTEIRELRQLREENAKLTPFI
jgi:hypothetical protein